MSAPMELQRRPLALDLFCGAGGAAMGLYRAGFDVVGIDIKRQPRYPFPFIQADALKPPVRLGDFDLIWASPPCQAYSKLAAMHPDRCWPDLLPATRSALEACGTPFIIENVEGAPMAHSNSLDGRFGIVLCGTMFGLGVERGELRRHRAFETSFSVGQPACRHARRAVGVYGHGGHTGKHRMLYRREASEAMGMDWCNRDEMTQAIPPAYSAWIGHYAMLALGYEPTWEGT